MVDITITSMRLLVVKAPDNAYPVAHGVRLGYPVSKAEVSLTMELELVRLNLQVNTHILRKIMLHRTIANHLGGSDLSTELVDTLHLNLKVSYEVVKPKL